MIMQGMAGLLRSTEPNSRNQVAGFFLWNLEARSDLPSIHGGGIISAPLIYSGEAQCFWLDSSPLPELCRAHLFGSSGDGTIGCIVSHIRILNELETMPLGTLIRYPLCFVIEEILQYDADAINRKITLDIGGRNVVVDG